MNDFTITEKLTGATALAAFLFCSGVVFGQQPAPAPQPPIQAPAAPTPLPPLTPEWQAGFCAGWNMSAQIGQQRFTNWRSLLTVTRTEDSAKTQVGQVTDLLVQSVPVYVLMQQATGMVTLQDGRTVNCGATP